MQVIVMSSEAMDIGMRARACKPIEEQGATVQVFKRSLHQIAVTQAYLIIAHGQSVSIMEVQLCCQAAAQVGLYCMNPILLCIIYK